MTITAQDILSILGRKAWSSCSADDMIWGNEDALTAQAELNSAHRYLMSREDFPFNIKKKTISTVKNQKAYPMCAGQIAQIVNKDMLQPLKKLLTFPLELEKSGTPQSYYIDYNNPEAIIVFYPVPDDIYNFELVYDTVKYILDKDGNQLDEFKSADDILNLPQYLEYLYMDCLVLRTMEQKIKDAEDENYTPIIKELQETWRNFIRKASPSKNDCRVVI